MIDRFGKRISIYWPEHHLVMVRAALTLDRAERQAAFADIASLTTRNLGEVRDRAKRIRDLDRRQAEAAIGKRVMRLPAGWLMPPSQIAPPSRAKLMGCR